MTFYHFCPSLLLSFASLNKHFLDTCCFNKLDYMVLLLHAGVKGQLHRWIFTCNCLPVFLCYSKNKDDFFLIQDTICIFEMISKF